LKKQQKFYPFIVGTLITFVILALSSPAQSQENDELIEAVKRIEEKLGARIGIAVYDEETGRNWQYHADDRFPITSTFKTLACATLLSRVDAEQEQLDRILTFEESTLVTYSPITKARVGTNGMSLSELCEATMFMSDNTAANLILDTIGGPAAITAFTRSIGDEVTRLDRREPDLNEAAPGDERDTTTPNAMAITLRTLVLGDALSEQSREQLAEWLKGNKVGDALFRIGVPSDWIVGDRTGAGGNGSRSIAAIMWPPKREPIIATVYIAETEASFDARNAAIAEIGKLIAITVLDQ